MRVLLAAVGRNEPEPGGMGKRGKKQSHQRHTPRTFFDASEDEEEIVARTLPSSSEEEPEEQEQEKEDGQQVGNDQKEYSFDSPSKFLLYQQSVQSPKGDISYLQKFFLMYVGGRAPLHLQEDFCGTALLCTEWLRSDTRRTAIGLDLDLEALNWCLENNISKIGADGYSRISLYHGNVLQPMAARLVKYKPQDLIRNITLNDHKESSEDVIPESSTNMDGHASADDELAKRNSSLPARDIVCAFNYSCCCLHKRADLVLYFKHVLGTLSRRGGIFVMDIYGGISSERELRLQRRFPNFTYFWEQAEFDIINRTTRISLHFHLRNQQRKLRHAFSYNWRLWSLPEIKDCLEEAGFRSVHFWIKQMPDTQVRNSEGFGSGRDLKYEEVSTFQQQDAWNAYIIGVAK
ncbi:PREDICTED: uncharacterized protein LOC104588259 [Nelumbo nucifera]|uniref:Uncharacterized protein LOC104588259 n=1 Tax=Nelumbo nucifera TaxID=4432 RepID=A0A1U7YXZ3_NELNU|nr:PREDICTED: uncharacterized protein LOC104588259 [Nelumbo nucifera]